MSRLISHLSYSCGVRVKSSNSEQILVQGPCRFVVSQFGRFFFVTKTPPTHTLYEDFLDLDADIRGNNDNFNANLALATTHSDNCENPVKGI